MIISLIAALTDCHVIGINNVLPWHCFPIDMQWFKYHTLNKPVIMGRKTFESIGKTPLKNRINIVLSRFLSNNYSGVYVVKNIDQALSLVKNDYTEVMIIGGGEMYDIFLSQSRRLYLTYVHANFPIGGDTWFPMYNVVEWKLIFSRSCNVIKKNHHYYILDFNILERHI